MNKKKKVCVITGSRAEYGQLEPLLLLLREDTDIDLQLVVSGAHLEAGYGSSLDQIKKDGFEVRAQVPLGLEDNSSEGVGKAIGRGVGGFATAFAMLLPDLVIFLGDRYEILAAATAALVAKIPMAHLGGGDTTEGAFDEAIRHSLTKMAHLHFATHAEAANRILQLGENPKAVFTPGSLAIDQIKRQRFLTKSQLGQELGIKFASKNLLITFHPETLALVPSGQTFEALLEALRSLLDREGPDVRFFFTYPNADPGGVEIINLIESFLKKTAEAVAFNSLGSKRYLSLMAACDLVVGNSSSGLYEAPSLNIATVDIGDRQKGRIAAPSVVRCGITSAEIGKAISQALAIDCSDVKNPYGTGNAAQLIYKQIKTSLNEGIDIRKHFFDLKEAKK